MFHVKRLGGAMNKKGKIIVLANQKGGVGKTTTAINLSAALSVKRKKILIVDADPQGNTTSGLGLFEKFEKKFYHLLVGDIDVESVLLKLSENISVIPSDQSLAAAEIELINAISRETVIKDCLEGVKNLFDYIVIDCPPSLGLLTINALTAADEVLVPVQCEYFAMEGLVKLVQTIQIIQKKLNKKLKINGIVFTMFDKRNNLTHEVAAEIKKHFGKDVYQTVIPRNIRLSECTSHGCSIFDYDKRSPGAKSYAKFAAEFLRRLACND